MIQIDHHDTSTAIMQHRRTVSPYPRGFHPLSPNRFGWSAHRAQRPAPLRISDQLLRQPLLLAPFPANFGATVPDPASAVLSRVITNQGVRIIVFRESCSHSQRNEPDFDLKVNALES